MKDAGPIVKWAGGKGRVVQQYAPYLLQVPMKRYFEPFAGGAAVYFWLYAQRGPFSAFLSDANEELIHCYSVVKKSSQELIELLRHYQGQHGPEFYYQMRASQPSEPLQRAARFIYLNRTCFNGLYRVNSKGLFNVPMGRYKDPNVVQEARLQWASQALQKVELRAQTFDKVARKAKAGDLVYFDPPYQPLSATSSFTSYTQEPFGPEQQWKLAQLFAELVSRGCYVFLSNSDTPLVRELYADFECLEVQATRMINSKSDRRQAIGEVLVLGNPKS